MRKQRVADRRVAEILEKKDRGTNRFFHEACNHITDLISTLDENSDLNKEFLKYFPVAAVAAVAAVASLEAFFKSAVTSLIDTGEPYGEYSYHHLDKFQARLIPYRGDGTKRRYVHPGVWGALDTILSFKII